MAASTTCMAVRCSGILRIERIRAGIESSQRSVLGHGCFRGREVSFGELHGGCLSVTRKAASRGREISAAKQRNISPDKKSVSAPAPPSPPVVEDLSYRPKLPGDEPDMFEGPEWDWLGFVVEYLWAFGIVVAIVACLFAVRGYNDGAVDFRETAEFKATLKEDEFVNLSPADALLLDAPPLLD
eukprot:TRINITY_DN755_c0_g2_i1.p1 TRINITY_DN755_c0_g2~~TRINITY_DN755_c0_g2_i1.p1  ORF type:complete len:184 (+),score=27.40 TRINITY_DN755_c0_g2_i1:26-577(+)